MKFKNPLSKKGDKKSDGGAQPPSNPYASAPPGGDPYMNGNSFANMNANSNPPPYQSVAQDQYRREKSPAVTGPGGGYGSGYGGSSGGYGRNQPYGAPPSNSTPDRSRRPGGYGGFGSDSQDPNDGNRDALFGNAPQRNGNNPQNSVFGQNSALPNNNSASSQYRPAPQTSTSAAVIDPTRDALMGNAAQRHQQNHQFTTTGQNKPDTDSDYANGYGTYGSAPKTAEEEEEDNINATKQEMKTIKRKDLDSTSQMIAALARMEQSAGNTLVEMQRQNESLHHTERVLDSSAAQSKVGYENIKTLDKTNGSMFYRGRTKELNQREDENLRNHQEGREERDRLTKEAYISKTKAQAAQHAIERRANGTGWQKSSLNERAKYQFENDSEDDALEDGIANNLDEIHARVGGLGYAAKALGVAVDESVRQVDRLHRKTDKVDDQIITNRGRLERIN